MLLKLTCPSCGRAEEVPERVIGKEIRCPCGTRFRVMGPNATGASASSAPPTRERLRLPKVEPLPRPARLDPELTVGQRRAPRAPDLGPWQAPTTTHATIPPWAYAAGGAAAVVVLGAIIVLAHALVSSRGPAPAPAPAGHLALETPPASVPTVVRTEQPSTVTTTAAPLAEQTKPTAPESEPASSESTTTAKVAEVEPAVTPVPLPPVNASPTGSLTTAQIVARCEPSVALIKGKVSSGTGFIVKPNVVATNAHVIDDEFVANLEVRFPSAPAGAQGPLHVQLLYEDRKRDLAFLGITTKLPVLEVAQTYRFIKGEDVTVIGNPGLGDDQVLENAVSRGVMSSKTVIEGMNYLQMNIAINPGNSGGPVFDSAGRVIGVATLKASKAEATAFCIPVEDLQKGLSQAGKPRPDLVARHRRELTFKILVTAGALYAAGLETRASTVQAGVPAGPSSGSTSNTPNLHDIVSTLESKMFALVEPEIPQLGRDATLTVNTRRSYTDLAANYHAMKDLYHNPGPPVADFFAHVQNLKDKHLRLVESIKNDLKLDVPEKLMALLQRRTAPAQQQPDMVAGMMPFQPRLFIRSPGMRPPGMRPQGPNAMMPPGARNQMRDARQRMKQAQDRMRDLQNRARGVGPGS